MKKKIIIGIVLLAIIVTIVLLVRRERNVNVYEYPSTLVVNNVTRHKNADVYSKMILNKIYHYDTITLNIYYAPRDYGTDEYDVAGFIQRNIFEPHTYNIFVKKGTLPISVKSMLSHELVHLHQMEIGDLVQLQDDLKRVWKGDTISLTDVPYDERPFEIQALREERGNLKQLNRLLYSK